MTVKEASVKFNIEEKEIRNRKKDNMIIGARKEGRNIVIPDDTVLIPSKKDIQSFLLQIVKYKNNQFAIISRSICPSDEQMKAVMCYLYNRGFIGEYIFSENIKEMFNAIQITDDGFDFMLGHGTFQKLSNIISSPIQINPNLNFSVVKVG